MGFWHTHRVFDGINISGHGRSIDVFVIKISGSRKYRETDLQIFGLQEDERDRTIDIDDEENRTIHISSRDGLVPITENIRIGIRDRDQTNSEKVSLHYKVNGEYDISPIRISKIFDY